MYTYIKRLFILAFIIFLSAKVNAFDLNSESKTYFSLRENSENQRIIPFYEYVDLDVNDIAKEEMSFHFGGWLRQDLAEKSFNDKKFASDLQYGYFSLSDQSRNIRFDLGRLIIFEGVSYERVDGIYASSNLKYNFSVSAYGGRSVKTNFDETGNYIFGSRLSQGMSNSYRLGISYLREKDYGTKLRDEAGIDGWFIPLKSMELSGRSVMNLEKSAWKEHEYHTILGPFNKLRMILDSQWINYEYYFLSLTSNAFKLQPDIINPDEKVLILGGQADYIISGNLLVSADYKNYNYKILSRADYYGGKGKYSVSDTWGLGSDLHRMNGGDNESSYYESRLYVYRNFAKLDAVVDLFNVNYDAKINDVKNAYSGTIILGYKANSHIRLSSDLSYSHNPEFNKDVRLFLKFVYGFDKGEKSGEKNIY